MNVRGRIVAGAVVAGSVVAAIVGSQDDESGGEEPQTTVTITFVGSDLFAADDLHIRRALQGGTLAGSYVAWTEDGGCNVVSFAHVGVGYDPRPWDSRLSGCDWAEADLGSSANTATQVGAAFETAAATLGSACDSSSGVATCEGGSDPIVGDAMAAAVPATRGMYGFQRNDWGDLDAVNQDGAGGGTGLVHVVAPCDGRVVGAYAMGDGGADIRLGVASGGAYSTTPSGLTGGAECVVEAADNNVFASCAFDEPIAMTDASNMWIAFRDVAEQTIRIRAHSNTPEGNGDLVDGERLVDFGGEDDPSVEIFTDGAYTPVGGSNFAVYMAIGMLYECENASGRFAGDGSLDTWYGTLREDAAGGSPVEGTPDTTVEEVIAFRIAVPQWTSTSVTAAAYGLAAWDALDDMGLAFYEWGDLVYPTETTNTLLQSVGRWGTSGTGWQVHTLSSPVAIGTEALGVDAVIAIGTVYGLIAGGQADTLTIVFDDEDPGGTRTWSTLWEDDGREWSDFVLSSIPAEQAEYRTFGNDENSEMVAATPTTTWPATWDPGTIDDQPRNLPRLRIRYGRDGIEASES